MFTTHNIYIRPLFTRIKIKTKRKIILKNWYENFLSQSNQSIVVNKYLGKPSQIDVLLKKIKSTAQKTMYFVKVSYNYMDIN